MCYKRADFGPMQETIYGIGFHWETNVVTPEGKPLPHADAIEAFDVDAFVAQAVEAGAGHVMFTATSVMHWLPGPNPEVDKLIKGRTSKRDLIMEIANGLEKVGIKLMLYYHHGCDLPRQDPEWQEAVGGQALDQTKFHDNYCNIVSWMSEHYGPKVFAYWFDAAYGPMRRAAPPFKRWTAAAKAGFPDRLIAYNPGIEHHNLYTTHQDYWAGEVGRLNYVPRGNLTPSGLPWYALTSWHTREPMGGEWDICKRNRDYDFPAPVVEEVVNYLRRFQAVGGAVTFNLLCYQDGSAYPSDLQVMKEVKKIIRPRPRKLTAFLPKN